MVLGSFTLDLADGATDPVLLCLVPFFDLTVFIFDLFDVSAKLLVEIVFHCFFVRAVRNTRFKTSTLQLVSEILELATVVFAVFLDLL